MSLKHSYFNTNTLEHGKKLQLRCCLGGCFLSAGSHLSPEKAQKMTARVSV